MVSMQEEEPESTLRKAADKLPAEGSGLAKKVEDKLHVGDKGESSKTAGKSESAIVLREEIILIGYSSDVTPPTAEKTAAPVTTGDHKLSLKDKIKAKLHKH